ncbi:hypothetical protein QKU48_gp0333 [Fadolivirus algeromassiliense]|jgi:hypothetical protein|uniref:Uncharacterized protein n=1 Tax=Fadolivirus FV1/VV64 TaxID=3070911 RepID=A0A7D3UTZ5_9VIRU|nr:hypothetical protein QKU48_gp0333 [Fadolivirus algeromassiliense]QKF93791.1 hypothetical protein Fadolivirus_1_333 [Fadolivirus FV1/VV64]
MSNPYDENIEDRIKHIISNKLQDNEFKEGLDDKKMELIEKLFELFPDLKEKNKFIIEQKKNIVEDDTSNEIILDEFTYNNKKYYKDKLGAIWDEDANILGIIKNNDENGNPVCLFFNHDWNLNINIPK